MTSRTLKIIASAAMWAAFTHSFAADFSVGRSTVVLPGEGWKELSQENSELKYGGTQIGQINTETRAFYTLDSQSKINALVVVNSTKNGVGGDRGQIVYSPRCDSSADFFASGNTGFGRSYLECYRVFRPVEAKNIIQAITPEALPAVEKVKLKLPEGLVTIMSSYGNSNGTNLNVVVYTAMNFQGLDKTVSEKLPENVYAGHVAWARALMDEVKSSVRSISGKTVFPAIAFEASANAPKRTTSAP
jgi:hypothetical protein